MYGLVVLVIYTIVMLAVTKLFSARTLMAETFHIADRKIGIFQGAMSIAATWIWAPALFTSAEKAYLNGWPGLFWFLAPNVLCLLLFIPFARRIRNQMPQGITLSAYMAQKYQSKAVHGIYLLALAALSVLSTAVQLLAGAKILAAITGWPFWILTLALALIAFAYAQYSGIKASVLTDSLQMLFMLLFAALFVPLAWQKTGGLANLLNGLAGFSGEYTALWDANGLQIFLAFGLPGAVGLLAAPFADQCFWQRAFAIREERLASAFKLGSILFALVPLAMGMLGFMAAGTCYVAQDNGLVNFELISSLLPDWAMLPFLFMVISGLLSTVDSNLCAVASLTSDFNLNLREAKAAMLALLAAAIAIANIPGLGVTDLFLVYGALRATTMLPTVLTLLARPLKAGAVFAGIVSAMLIGIPLFVIGLLGGNVMLQTTGSLFALLLSGLISLVASSRKVVRA